MRNRTLALTRSLLAAALCGLFLIACGSGVTVRADVDPSVDLGQYQTYDFFSQMGIEQTSYPNLLGQHFREAISAQMDSRGYRKSAAPQLQVNVSVDVDDKVRVNTYQDPYLYGGYYGGYRGVGFGSPMYYGGGTTTTVHQYTEANVYIDLVDTAQHKMIWQGVATFTITEKNAATRAEFGLQYLCGSVQQVPCGCSGGPIARSNSTSIAARVSKKSGAWL